VAWVRKALLLDAGCPCNEAGAGLVVRARLRRWRCIGCALVPQPPTSWPCCGSMMLSPIAGLATAASGLWLRHRCIELDVHNTLAPGCEPSLRNRWKHREGNRTLEVQASKRDRLFILQCSLSR